ILLLDEIKHRFPGGGRHRIAAKRGNGRALHSVSDLRFRHRQPDRESVTEAFRTGHHVWRDAVLLDAEPLAARASPRRLGLVANEDSAVPADDISHDAEVFPRRRDESADALYRLGDEAGDPPGGSRADQLLDVLRALHSAIGISKTEWAAVAVRIVRM